MRHVLYHIKPKRGRSPAKRTEFELSQEEVTALAKKKLLVAAGSDPQARYYHSAADLAKIKEVRKALSTLATA